MKASRENLSPSRGRDRETLPCSYIIHDILVIFHCRCAVDVTTRPVDIMSQPYGCIGHLTKCLDRSLTTGKCLEDFDKNLYKSDFYFTNCFGTLGK